MTSVAAVLSAKYLLLITIFANVQIASGDACGHGAARNAARDVHGELKSLFLARGVFAVLTLDASVPLRDVIHYFAIPQTF
ncbi:MAG: hypothetical protein OD815_000883 [Candidatus Alkanophagales archaeon MCA70_species_2]|nr:hypothetical protein [Candidatus Alkanophaga liquidiphilum]